LLAIVVKAQKIECDGLIKKLYESEKKHHEELENEYEM